MGFGKVISSAAPICATAGSRTVSRRSSSSGVGPDEGLAPVQAGGGEHGDVAITSVLPQRRGHLPQGRHRVVRLGHLAVGGEQGATGG